MPVRLITTLMLFLGLSACMPGEVELERPDGTSLNALFYPGNDILDDLLIIEGVNYFGKAGFPLDDPLGDISFRFEDGPRVRAECVTTAKDILGDDQCVRYSVFNSDFDLIPEGTEFSVDVL